MSAWNGVAKGCNIRSSNAEGDEFDDALAEFRRANAEIAAGRLDPRYFEDSPEPNYPDFVELVHRALSLREDAD